jgi:hypothetical protein
MSETVQALDHAASQRRIRFVEQITGDDAVLMTFKDPVPGYAVLCEVPATATSEVAAEPRGDVLDVLLLPWPKLPQGTPSATNQRFAEWIAKGDGPDAPPPVFVKVRGVELMWRPGRAVLQCDSEQAESLLSAVVEFTHYECELRRIEQEIADTWEELEQDKALAFEVTPVDLERSATVGARMNRVLQRRIRLARIEPHLYEPAASFPTAALKLGDELREKVRTESRLETVDGQLEVFEGIYEMSGQRMGEYRAARQEHVLEWIIIVLLAAEMLLLLAQMVWKSGV